MKKRKIGSSWKGKKYIHGPRLVNPKKCTEFRVGKPNKKGVRLVFCKLKKDGWIIQSKLTPR